MPIVLSTEDLAGAVRDLARQVREAHSGEVLKIVGIRSRGDEVAERMCAVLAEEGVETQLGLLDISLYRDDFAHLHENPKLQGSRIDFLVEGAEVILVDDVLFTGRTIRAALDALSDYGRPARVELAVLIDRGHREFPIEPRFVGRVLETRRNDRVNVRLMKTDGEDAVELIEND